MIVLALSRRGQEQGSSTFSNNRETALLCMVDGRLAALAHLRLNPRDALADGRRAAGGGGRTGQYSWRASSICLMAWPEDPFPPATAIRLQSFIATR